MSYGLMQKNSDLLFGGAAGNMDSNLMYSWAWQGQFAGEDFFSAMFALTESNDIPEFYTKLDGELGKEDYRGTGQNMLLADTSGNIGYRLLMTIPERKDKTPFISNRVLDGTTTKWDWTGKIIPQRDLPRSINPKKGYIVTANGRQTSDNAINDYGAMTNNPGRYLRLDEMLRDKTTSGEKISLADMSSIQQDVIDVIARRTTPVIFAIAAEEYQDLAKEQKEKISKLAAITKDWQGSFEETSIAAPVYTRFYIQFLRLLFTKQAGEDENQRMAFSDHYGFTDSYQRLLNDVKAKKE